MGTTSIRVSEDCKRRLDLAKRESESYEDVIRRLTEREKWAGFGVLDDAEGDTRTAMTRIRESMREGTTADIEATDDRPR
ncbi:DUF7557 family protein [Halococcoides cellulosivorans]|uniref:Sugar metabolism cluster protein n=1 Tax=Halococcoides cellulosivorans TaxID=1679096 RepID=A0A2R4X029_9EURY|nr:antitoxin VapB family protein [Halococcoides cellulosivorans]AWB27129.1 sugar metabolism cluster protein [Halococcoides cellulosivorans]